MCRGIGQRINDLDLFDDRTRPSMSDDERQSIFMLGTNMNEMNVQPIYLGDEMWNGAQFRLDLAPIVFRPPIMREGLHGRELHTLRRIRDSFLFRQLGCVDAPAQFGQVRLWNVYMKRTNGILVICLLAALWCST